MKGIAPIPHRKIAMQVVTLTKRILRLRVDISGRRSMRELRTCIAAEAYTRGSVIECS